MQQAKIGREPLRAVAAAYPREGQMELGAEWCIILVAFIC